MDEHVTGTYMRGQTATMETHTPSCTHDNPPPPLPHTHAHVRTYTDLLQASSASEVENASGDDGIDTSNIITGLPACTVCRSLWCRPIQPSLSLPLPLWQARH